jgi:hypothetical protein
MMRNRSTGLVTSIACLAYVLTLPGCAARTVSDDSPGAERRVLRLYGAQVETFVEASRTTEFLAALAQDAWAVLPQVYEQLDIPVTDSVPELMELGNPGYRTRRVEGKRMGAYIDCGMTHAGTLANLYDITLSVITRVAAVPGGGTEVTTTVDAWGKQTATAGNPIHCRSKETLERRVLELIGESLGVPVGGAS